MEWASNRHGIGGNSTELGAIDDSWQEIGMGLREFVGTEEITKARKATRNQKNCQHDPTIKVAGRQT
jgi:hypothetical protein